MLQKITLGLGIFCVAIGILGFVPGITSDGLLLGIFAVNTLHNVLGVWLLLWLVVGAGLAAPFVLSRVEAARRWPPVMAPILGLLGLLALRAVVIFSVRT